MVADTTNGGTTETTEGGPVQQYYCGKCDTAYDTQDEADQCAWGHTESNGISKQYFDSPNSDEPDRIVLNFPSGSSQNPPYSKTYVPQ